MTSPDQPDLLFFDTFSHDTSEELNLDLVQFPKSVYVREIRIIPLGARVEGDFPGGVRLGATNPTKFHIDFFVNDLSKPGASTFEALGSLDYCQNGQIHMECTGESEEARIPTDGLVLRGWYTTITLAVYGSLTQVINNAPPITANPPQTIQRQTLPAEVVPTPPESVPQPEWNPEASNPIPTYTGNVATTNPEAYGPNYPPENYDPYRTEYYESEGPKDPRPYHIGDPEWEKPRLSVEREGDRRLSPRSIDHERDRDRRGRRRTRSRSRRRDRSRDLDRVDHRRSRSRSRDRDYIVKGEYRALSRSRSRSPEVRSRSRALSNERDWDRSSYKKDDYRRRRDDSYDRSRAGSYDKRSGSFDRRSPYGKRTPSYERKRGVSPYDKRGSSYERRAPSYDKQAPYDKKRHSPYRRLRGSSYSSRSPSRDDPRKRPRTPPGESSRRPLSPREGKSPVEEAEFDRSGKQIPRVEFYHQSYRHKSSIRSPSQEVEPPPFVEPQHSSLVTVQIVDTSTKPTIESPVHNPEDEKSMDAEQFEPILSDEDICDDGESPAFMEVDYEANDYCIVDDIIKYFNPFKTEWVQYQNVNKIHLLATGKQTGVKDVTTASFDELCDVNSDLLKISEVTKLAKGREQKFYASTFTDIDNPSREEWVHQCEQISSSIMNLCKNTDIILRIFQNQRRNDLDEFADIFNLIITFCKIGLSFDYALAQLQPTYKIRHMKCGIRLVEALLSHRHNGVVMTMLLKAGIDVPMMLMELYAKEYMALSIRLMILKSLSVCLSSKEAIDQFMRVAHYPKFDKNDSEPNQPKNGYQALIAIMQMNPLARIKFSLSALIKKLNMYELMGKLYKIVLDFNQKAAESQPNEEVEFSESNTEFIVDALGEILHLYRTQCFHISQPKRFLPVSAQFDINKDCSNEVLLEFFNIHHVLEACLYVLTCPSTCGSPVLASPAHDLVYELVHSHNGINFLYNNIEISELLFKTLVQPYGQNTEDFIYPHDLSNYTDLQILGLELAYRLRCIYHLNSICDLQAGKPDDNELINRLQSLYCLSFGSIGKVAVPDVIVMGDNAECLMEVFEKTTKTKLKNESPSKQKSPAKGYAIELIAAAVRFSSNVPFLKKYGHRLLNVSKVHDKFEPSVSSVLQEIVPYLKPIEKSTLISGDDMAECIDILKRNLEHAPDLPGELMTCLRVLRHFCISDYDTNVLIENESAIEEYVELKYKYNVLQLFSLDGVVHLSGILDRLTVHFEQPSMHTAFFASVKGLQLAQMLIPCLRLLDEMLARVVRCRGSKFRDLTAAPILLKTYGLAKAYPVGSVGYRSAAKAAEAAVRALLAYSQPIADDATDNDSIRRGPWTTLCSEVISYTMTAPYTFVPGLLVFSELLPLPLPMHTKIVPTEQELSDALNERRLWSGHLHALTNDLTDMIQVICMSTYRVVVHMLRRVCVQVADLAPAAAGGVARAAGGAALRELAPPPGAAPGAAPGPAPASAAAARVLGFLACLVAHAPVKCAVLCGGPALPAALAALLRQPHAAPDHAAAQEYAAHILAGLCDVEVTLTPLSAGADVVIANSLPNKETLLNLLEASVDCLESTTKTFTVATAVLRAYFVLTEYEYGFQQFRKIISKRRESFGKFFRWALEGPGEDRLECLNLYIDLVRMLRSEEAEGPLGRRAALGPHELADLLGYAPGDLAHPVHTLENTLKERNADEEAISNAAFLVANLPTSPPAAPPSPPAEEPLAPWTLVQQFAARAAHAGAGGGGGGGGGGADERLTASYWLNVPAPAPQEDDANDQELVSCDVMSVAGALLDAGGGAGGAAALAGAVRRLAGAAVAPSVAPAGDRPPPALCLSAARGGADAFRSRPPNTSRPPSLHVDDFTRASHDYSLTNNNRAPRRGAAAPDRGRFASATPLHAPPHYRHLRGRGAWEMAGQHFPHFPPSAPYMMGGMGWGGGRMQRGPRHRSFMR